MIDCPRTAFPVKTKLGLGGSALGLKGCVYATRAVVATMANLVALGRKARQRIHVGIEYPSINKINKCIRLDELCSQSLPYIREIYHEVLLGTVHILVIREHAEEASLSNYLF